MKNQRFTIQDDFMLDNQPIKIISGAIHYFRVVRAYWQDRLEKLVAMGCNTVETYVPWNLHEPKKGSFTFAGMLDLPGFIRLAKSLGLWVIVRPTPYICGEWEFGGLPGWLLKEDGMRLRCSYGPFLNHVRDYYKVLLPLLTPLQIDKGGPIILMQIENEYGAYGNELAYMEALRDCMLGNGVTVPLVTSDGPWGDYLQSGKVAGAHMTANFGSKAQEQFAVLRRHVPKGPLLCMEFWVGWFDAWGDDVHHTTSAADCAKELDALLSMGSANIYMLHGGTNFGFTNGANYYGKLMADVSSYDYDSPISECGDITEKYLAMRAVIGKHSVLPQRELPQNTPKKAFGKAAVTQRVSLFAAVEALAQPVYSPWPLCMEKLDQNFGYTLYRSKLPAHTPVEKIWLVGANDRAQIFADKEKCLTLYDKELLQEHTLTPRLEAPQWLDILVENMGRVNYGPLMEKQRKGIDSAVVINGHTHAGWEMYSLHLDEKQIEAFNFAGDWAENQPGLYKIPLTVDTPADTFLDMSGWGKGVAILNGFNLGRFWEKGPQKRLYIPAPLFKQGENELIIFETEGTAQDYVSFYAEPDLGKPQ